MDMTARQMRIAGLSGMSLGIHVHMRQEEALQVLALGVAAPMSSTPVLKPTLQMTAKLRREDAIRSIAGRTTTAHALPTQ